MAPPPTPVNKRTTATNHHPTEIDDLTNRFASIKLPVGTLGTLGHARSDLTIIGTLGSRKGFVDPIINTNNGGGGGGGKQRLQGLFDPPLSPPDSNNELIEPINIHDEHDNDLKTITTTKSKAVRISSGKPSIIDLFAPTIDIVTSSTLTITSTSGGKEYGEPEEEEEESEEIDDEEFARRMENTGLEVTLVYEEVVEATEVVEA